MVQGGVVICTLVGQVWVSWCPVVAKVFLGVAASEPPEAHVYEFEHFFTMVLLVTPMAVEFLHWTGEGG